MRRAALTQSTGAPIDSYVSHDGDKVIDMRLPGALVVEPRGGSTTGVPLPSIVDVTRDGWTITVASACSTPWWCAASVSAPTSSSKICGEPATTSAPRPAPRSGGWRSTTAGPSSRRGDAGVGHGR